MNTENSPYIFVKKIVIHGLDTSYEATFEDGINLIWGDMDCGKSSILNLIDYCLGEVMTPLHMVRFWLKVESHT